MKVLRKQRRDASPNVKAETSDHRALHRRVPRVRPSYRLPSFFFPIFFFFFFILSPLADRSSLMVRRVFVLTTKYRGALNERRANI